MKKIILSACMAILAITISFAQTSEGHIVYNVTVSSDNPEMEMVIDMMQDANLEVYFKGHQSYTLMSMGAMMTMKTIISDSGDVLMLMSGMMGSKAIKTTNKELEGAENDEEDVEVTLADGTKTIAGYECKKAIITTDGGSEVIFWYTDEIVAAAGNRGNMNGKIPGIALAFEADENGLSMTYSATTVTLSVDDSVFNMDVPAGYEVISFADFTNLGM